MLGDAFPAKIESAARATASRLTFDVVTATPLRNAGRRHGLLRLG